MKAQNGLPAPPPLQGLLAGSPIALFLDFDGTLVEIASGPDAISVPEQLGKMLENLEVRLDGALAVVSGRSIDSLGKFLGPVAIYLAGSHGGQVLAPNGDVLREAQALPGHVTEALDRFSRKNGLLYERKAHGAALHFRAKPELARHAQTFVEALAEEHGLVVKIGKCVTEILRPGVDKGGAVELLCVQAPFARTIPIFVGDDVTDEDGFEACNRLGGFAIMVGDRDVTAARYRLANVGEVHAWLNL